MWSKRGSSVSKTTIKTKTLKNGNILEYTVKNIDGKKEYHIEENSKDFSGVLYDGFDKSKADQACSKATESARRSSFVEGALQKCNLGKTKSLFKEMYAYDDDKCAIHICRPKGARYYMAWIHIPKDNIAMETADPMEFEDCLEWINKQRLLHDIMEVENED